MKIDRTTLLAVSPEQAADLLFHLGRDLRGTNLKRSSWLLIANALQIQRMADILFQRLEAATTRQDALRVLRIARKAAPPSRRSSRGAPRPALQENLMEVAADTSPQAYQEYDEEARFEEMMEVDTIAREDMDAWHAEQENARPLARARQPGLLPVSPTQDAIDRYAWEHRPLFNPQREDLRSRVDDHTYQRLIALTRPETGLRITELDREFLQANGLVEILDYVDFPSMERSPISIQDGIALAAVRIIEDRTGVYGHPFAIDWEPISRWLLERLIQKPDSVTSGMLIAAAYEFFRDAPVPVLKRFLQQSVRWHRAWSSLLWYALPRVEALLPDRQATVVDSGWWGISGAPMIRAPWERLLDAGTGSRLVLHNLVKNVEDLFHDQAQIKDQYWNNVRKLLMAGGGTLRRMDYPEFTLLCRPSITLVRLETFGEILNLGVQILMLNNSVTMLTRERLAEWIRGEYAKHTTIPLPESLHTLIASVLEHHAIAYILLKERVLREAFLAAPFRIRRKHIQRFWADQEASAEGIRGTDLPKDYPALKGAFGVEALKEALAHALLDHFKDDWGAPEETVQPLKEALLSMLRGVAITYHIDPPDWLEYFPPVPTEDDLEHTQELANFLIRQTENAVLEMAQALRIDPGQGLPRLAGGQLTSLERNCRRLVKAIAGVSQKKLTEAEPRIFTCRPISKCAALDRGDLAGDCSSGSVPMRSLSPHHIYYGIFEHGEQQRGYITVYEAGAEILREEGPGEHIPVLCLETINVPIRVFDAIQQDLLLIIDAVAKSRGLAERLVLITNLGTWNYQNGEVLRQSRRFRQGKAVRLYPADPASWNVYRLIATEAEYYTAFFDDSNARRYDGDFRLLAPFNPTLDAVEQENIAEAGRIAALPPKQLRITAQGKNGPAGFISELPQIL